jgi:hypothetical protein
VAKLDARLELRLDKRTYERLERRAAAGHLSVAQFVRQAIARELADDEGSWREQVLERGLSLDVPVPGDPADLVRELDAGYETEAAVSPEPAWAAPAALEGAPARMSGVARSSRPPKAPGPNRRA